MFVSPAEGRVTSHWGPRERHPVTGQRGFHRGIDIAPPRPGQTGVPVYACYAGVVRAVRTGRRNGDRTPNPITGTWNTGNYVLIDGPGGGSEWYGHLATITVAPGDLVNAGDRLGTMGDSGNVTGIHLHLEMWDGRTQGGGSKGGNTRDPRIDFKAHGVVPGSRPIFPKTPTALPEEDEMTPAQEAKLDRLLDLATKNNHALGRIDPGHGKRLVDEITGSRPLDDTDVDVILDTLRKVKDAAGRTDPGKGKKLVPVLADLLDTIKTQEA